MLTGEEVTTRTGHVLAVGTDPGTFVDWRYRARDGRFGRFARAVRQAGGLVVPAHPHATCIGCAWKFGYEEVDAVEVWNGPWTPDDEVSLASWDATLRGADGDRPPRPGPQRLPPRPGPHRLRVADPAAEVLVRLSVTGAEGCDLRLVTDQGLAFTAPAATSLGAREREGPVGAGGCFERAVHRPRGGVASAGPPGGGGWWG